MKAAKTIQLIIWLTLRSFIANFSHFEIIYTTSWSIKNLSRPAILVANHRGFNDYIYIGSLFPFNSKLLPLRYLVARGYMSMKTGPLALILRLGGCISVSRTNKGKKPLAEVLKNVERALANHQIIIIFPEGKRIKHHKPVRGGRGTAYLAMKYHVPVVPLYIDCNLPSFWRLILRKNHVHLYVGAPFYLEGDHTDNKELIDGTKLVLQRICSLAP